MFDLVLVDDEPWALRGVQTACDYSSIGFRVSLATVDPHEALRHALTNKIDAVITDINMSQMSGIELMGRVRAEKSATQFVVISGYSDFEYARGALRYGAFAYLLKPLDKAELHEVMVNLAKERFSKPQASVADAPAQGNMLSRRIVDFLEENYHRDISLNEISQKFFLSPTYICDLFRRSTGVSITEQVRTIRLNRAAEMLRNSDYSISEISLMVGYAEHSYFGKLFRKTFHVTPSEYRKAEWSKKV